MSDKKLVQESRHFPVMKRNLSQSFGTKQKGVAAIITALLMLPMMGAVHLSLESTRLIQKQNRMADAAESATLAVSMANREEIDSRSEDYSHHLARLYIEQYIDNMEELKNLDVTRTEGKEQIEDDDAYFVKYQVDATAHFESWMGDKTAESSGSDVANSAMAKTYQLPSDLDLVFITDFSGSMDYRWSGSERTKLSVLKEQVNIISTNLLSSHSDEKGYAHRIGVVPYNMRTQDKVNNVDYCVTQLKYLPEKVGDNYYDYDDLNWYEWSGYSEDKLNDCADNKDHCPDISGQNDQRTRREAKAIEDIIYRSSDTNSRYPDMYEQIDFAKTVNQWNDINPVNSKNIQIEKNYNGIFNSGMCKTNFNTLPLERKIPDIDDMDANGGTAVYQGVIRGAQILLAGKPQNNNDGMYEDQLEAYHERSQMLLILSDGQEDPLKRTFQELVDKGLCDKIREEFQDHKNPLYIGVLGIDFNAEGQTSFKDCADDVIDVENSEDLIYKIEEQIRKGSATNGISRLYDQTLG
ncbi:pilus assembly protein [Vibrio sp. SS-MA-C1-2]|uniref:TadE/TadG family type IV pilus assembly protein n=1 Tax=Vibrio sp. SS-MA-C1-2 TaxID=2908646 RepID=UPI001F192D49|nr:TadE/TadG family type IV pilus assembly protein [Vibrio sp. SS-MA-C1-2]UJF17510.1 pilus assembly protein [Vibrio sp. SS-MA-C1-2]